MKIEFDTSNAAELIAVAALIGSLRADHKLAGGTFERDAIGEHASDAPHPLRAAVDSFVAAGEPHVTVDGPAPLASVSPVVPPVPAAIIAPPAQSPGGVDLDATGLPYDARIHSKPPSKKANGEWRGKRNLDETTRTAVTAELRAALAAPAATDPLPPSEQAVDAATAFAAPVATTAVSPPPPPPAPRDVVAIVAESMAPPPPPPPAPVVTPAASEFAGLMRKITALQTAGILDVAGTTAIAAALGINGVRDLMVRPDLIPSFEALLPAAA